MSSLYDSLNGWGPDFDYWLAVAKCCGPESIVDLGCGTGQLTVELARAGYATGGIDPDAGMLSVARNRDGHESVTWIDGHAADISTASADLVLMTSHVSQVFLSDDDWLAALREIHRGLRPGGHVAFDMRNPNARGWEEWNPVDSRRTVSTESGAVEVWHEVTTVRDAVVTFETTTRNIATGSAEVATDSLRFRGEADLRSSLSDTGFLVEHIHGDWDGAAVTSQSRELIVSARRP